MQPIPHGTIVVCLKRDDFLVLAADRLGFHGDPGNPERIENIDKIAIHPQVPLAMAFSGFNAVIQTIGNKSYKTYNLIDILNKKIFDVISSNEHATPENITKLIESDIYPLVLTTIEMMKVEDFWWLNPILNLFVCSFINEKPEIYRIELHEHMAIHTDFGDRILSYPKSLIPWYGQKSHEEENSYFGSDHKTVGKVASHARSIIVSGISYELEKFGKNITCGLGVDIVIVDKLGARFVSDT